MTQKSIPFISLLKNNKNFTFLWIGQIASRIGDGIIIIALPWLVYKIGTEADLGTVMALYSLAAFLFGYIAGTVADRYSRKKLMILSSIGAGFFVGLMPFLYSLDALIIPILGLLAFLASVSSQFFEPALDASIPNIVDEEILETANSLSMGTRQVGMIAGPALAGFLISMTSISFTLTIDAVSFLILAGIVGLVSIPQEIPESGGNAFENFAEDFRGLIMHIKQEKVILIILVTSLTANAILGPFYVITPVFAKNVLVGGSKTFGTLISVLSIGSILGMVIVGQFRKTSGRLFMLVGIFSVGTSLLLLGRISWMIGVILLFLSTGMGIGLVNVPARTALQKFSPDQVRGKVMGITMTVGMAGRPASQAAAGFILSMANPQLLYMSMGIGVLILTLFLAFSEDLKKI